MLISFTKGMPTFSAGSIEKLPWRELHPFILSGDRPLSRSGVAVSPSMLRLRRQWNACEEWNKYETSNEDERARLRYTRTILTPERFEPQSSLPRQEPTPSKNSELHYVDSWCEFKGSAPVAETPVSVRSPSTPLVSEGCTRERPGLSLNSSADGAPGNSIEYRLYNYHDHVTAYFSSRIRNL